LQGVRVAESHRILVELLELLEVELGELLGDVRREPENLGPRAEYGRNRRGDVEIDRSELIDREGRVFRQETGVRLFEQHFVGDGIDDRT